MIETLIGHRYRLLELIGTGGEARVFRARDEETLTEVALRLPLRPIILNIPASLPAPHSRWTRLLASGLDSTHGTFQVFELLQGETLDTLVRQAPFDRQTWSIFVQQSLETVEALHAVQWVHGDLNADNFFRVSNLAIDWKLLELPFLRLNQPKKKSSLFGSIYTLAPEQLDGAPADIRTDLYALGCLYYYAACGHYPHVGANSAAIAVERLRFPAEPLHPLAPQLPPQACEVVMTLLARSPQARLTSIAAARQLLAVA